MESFGNRWRCTPPPPVTPCRPAGPPGARPAGRQWERFHYAWGASPLTSAAAAKITPPPHAARSGCARQRLIWRRRKAAAAETTEGSSSGGCAELSATGTTTQEKGGRGWTGWTELSSTDTGTLSESYVPPNRDRLLLWVQHFKILFYLISPLTTNCLISISRTKTTKECDGSGDHPDVSELALQVLSRCC